MLEAHCACWPPFRRVFQLWYRDTMAQMSGFNTTDAIHIEFK